MCDLEEFLFSCGHNIFRLKSYCHFARNDPNHQCFGVKQLRDSWAQVYECEACRMLHQQQQRQASMSAYGGDQGSSDSRSSSYRR
ncbi:hypothetical protein CONLIGDRAFT_678038 [Coniochaeta ligniaria NRRL 30616]|uniref:Uncharacterized protein n=1 Tax=Coniochaeta ligniaria NRRL 30616 TaxID=1408157 RepID=A0A1J7JNV4_9PEZI|nr:hypothetical protein CONLIGDRAFT_678038 [Coniochaeta ligniaria NRRL 30616]